MKEILYKQTLKKVSDDAYRFERNFISEMTKEEVDSITHKLVLNINKLKLLLENVTIEDSLKRENKKLDDNLKVKQDALGNYEKYMSEGHATDKREAHTNKMKLQSFINTYEDFRAERIKQLKEAMETEKTSMETQLKEDIETMELYNDCKTN